MGDSNFHIKMYFYMNVYGSDLRLTLSYDTFYPSQPLSPVIDNIPYYVVEHFIPYYSTSVASSILTWVTDYNTINW